MSIMGLSSVVTPVWIIAILDFVLDYGAYSHSDLLGWHSLMANFILYDRIRQHLVNQCIDYICIVMCAIEKRMAEHNLILGNLVFSEMYKNPLVKECL
jgi:hypothetical protein